MFEWEGVIWQGNDVPYVQLRVVLNPVPTLELGMTGEDEDEGSNA